MLAAVGPDGWGKLRTQSFFARKPLRHEDTKKAEVFVEVYKYMRIYLWTAFARCARLLQMDAA